METPESNRIDTTDWPPEALKAIQEEEVYILRKSLNESLTDYQLLARQIDNIYYLLNRNPHSSDTTLNHIHQMVDEINRLTSVTEREHNRIKEVIRKYG